MVVLVGLTEVEPLADCELKPPGEMEIVLAPLVDQISVLLPPEAMLVGLAVNEAIEGAGAVPPVGPEPEPLPPVLPEPPVVPEPPEPDDDPPEVPDPVFVGLVVRPHAAKPMQISRAEISATRDRCAKRTASPKSGNPIVRKPQGSLPFVRASRYWSQGQNWSQSPTDVPRH